MRRLSLPIEQIKPHYTVIVVGSGYGGAIAASRMARAGQQVCVLERGKEFQPGEYPNNLAEATREFQADSPIGHEGSHTGLYDLRINSDVNVVLGCGLGGTSLINANVGLRAEPRVFDDPAWPEGFRTDSPLLEQSYARAERMLNLKPVPDSFPSLPKMNALQTSASALQGPFYRTPLYVTFDEPEGGVNEFGVTQHKCNGCGDCVSGCNFHAKNTTLMNYLPDAVNFGAEIFTSVSVRYLERDGKGWIVHFQTLGDGRQRYDAPDMFARADIVILGAGTLGSTEILLRSAGQGLPLSAKLGERFSSNGDVLGFGYNTDTDINGIGFGAHDPAGRAGRSLHYQRHRSARPAGTGRRHGHRRGIDSGRDCRADAAGPGGRESPRRQQAQECSGSGGGEEARAGKPDARVRIAERSVIRRPT